MSEQPSLAAQRRDNLAKARAVKAERRANGTYSMSGVHAKLDLQHQAIDALLHSQVNLVGLVEELAQTNLLMAQLLANPPTRAGDVAETLARMGQHTTAMAMQRDVSSQFMAAKLATLQPDGRGSADDTRDWGYQDRMEAQQAQQAAAPERYSLAPLKREGDIVRTQDGRPASIEGDALPAYQDEREGIPRGTAHDLDQAYDPTAMASELALMAAEDDEPPPPPDEWEMWSRRLSTFRGQRIWHPGWGPRPGQDGCRVPYEMLNGGGR